MIFMIHIDVHFPATVKAEELAAIRKAETERAIEFMGQGNLLRIWRIPASMSSRSLWSFGSAEDLDAAIKSLPAFPYFTHVSVTPLIDHPSANAYKERHGMLPPA